MTERVPQDFSDDKFKNDLDGMKKCEDCGYEWAGENDTCPNCGSHDLRPVYQ